MELVAGDVPCEFGHELGENVLAANRRVAFGVFDGDQLVFLDGLNEGGMHSRRTIRDKLLDLGGGPSPG